MSYTSSNQEQVECDICFKPIVQSHLELHKRSHNPLLKELMKENGYKFGVKGRTRQKIKRSKHEKLW